MTLPRKRAHQRMGVKEAVQKVWPRHRRFVRAHGCCVPGCNLVGLPIDFAHLRSAANAGIALRPHDSFAISLCRFHHNEQHTIGANSFGKKYGIDLWALAAEFTRKSPDVKMRQSLALMQEEEGAR